VLEVCESTLVFLSSGFRMLLWLLFEREQAFAAVSALDELGTRDVWTVS
jgi:hypothetical protein